MIDLLWQAIPKDEFNALHQEAKASTNDPFGYGYVKNGGTWRGNTTRNAMVASWNNTRPSEKEVVEWFEQAILLGNMKGEDALRNL